MWLGLSGDMKTNLGKLLGRTCIDGLGKWGKTLEKYIVHMHWEVRRTHRAKTMRSHRNHKLLKGDQNTMI